MVTAKIGSMSNNQKQEFQEKLVIAFLAMIVVFMIIIITIVAIICYNLFVVTNRTQNFINNYEGIAKVIN